MKTFRCVFFNGVERKVIDLAAPDALTAARRAAATQSRSRPFQRIEVEDEDGHFYVAAAQRGGPAAGRIRVFPCPEPQLAA